MHELGSVEIRTEKVAAKWLPQTSGKQGSVLFEVTDIRYAYADGTAALEDVSLTIESGDRLAVLGANGSGKSTLLRVLDGLLFPTSGAVRFKGRELSEASLKSAEFRQDFRQSVGFVFQNPDAQLFNATVFEELAFGPWQLGLNETEVKSRVDDVLDFLGIARLSDRAPFRLSGGEKRKVAIGSVLTMNPEVLIFDEPFLGLDPRSQSWLVRTLQQLSGGGKTTVVATHSLDLIPRVADSVLVLSESHRPVAHGPAMEVLADLNLLRYANLVE